MYYRLILIIFISFAIGGQTLDRYSAMDKALQKNPALLQVEAEKDAALWSKWSATTSFMPTVSLGYTNIWNDREIVFPIDSNMVAVIQPKEQWQKTADVTLPLFTGGALLSGQRISSFAYEISKSSYADKKELIRLETLEAYYGLVKMQGIVEITLSARQLVEENISMVKRMFELGMVQKKDLLQAQVNKSEINQQVQQASQGERLSLLQLNMAMGEPLDSEFEVDSALPPVKLHQSLDQLIEHGKKHRHSYNAASLTDDLAKWGVRATRGSLFPSVAAIYHWQEDSEASLFSGQDSWRAMLNVSFDIPLGLTNVASVQEAKAQHRQSRYLVKQALDGIMMEIEANHLQFQLMAESLEMAIQQMNAAEENYNAIKAGYEIGESIQLELIDARNSLTNAKINLMNTEIDHYISYNRLMYSSGYPIGE